MGVLKAFYRLFVLPRFARQYPKEAGYVYFQEFMPENKFDIRVIVIGEKAFAIKRMVRANDFRASGSGNILFDRDEIDVECVKIAFDTNRKIGSQSVGYDFVFDINNKPLIVEISYGFGVAAYDPCPGYWDADLKWHPGSFNPQEWMVEELIKTVESNVKNG
ncbi:MAG: hypothetical protein BGN93_11720 [Acinetobacter sp. 39-4]|nr:MAG: hypothetical protein BGN93_11720 [Acinetobacter sp. 39-4]